MPESEKSSLGVSICSFVLVKARKLSGKMRVGDSLQHARERVLQGVCSFATQFTLVTVQQQAY
jgi:hypothetical protein